MSFIGSTERTRGITSKLFSGGGDGVNHSSVFAFHGSGPATRPFFRDRTRGGARHLGVDVAVVEVVDRPGAAGRQVAAQAGQEHELH